MRRLALLLVCLVPACGDTVIVLPSNPTAPGGNTTVTNTNSTIIDLHDLVTFVPVPNPTAPVPTATGGTETPVGIPAGAEARARAIADANRTLLAAACPTIYGEAGWRFLDALVSGLAASDPRWGYLLKASTGLISQDVIAYRATADTIGAWAVDVIFDVCATNTFTWQVLGLDPAARWAAHR